MISGSDLRERDSTLSCELSEEPYYSKARCRLFFMCGIAAAEYFQEGNQLVLLFIPKILTGWHSHA
jgi:hypothetical protein